MKSQHFVDAHAEYYFRNLGKRRFWRKC